MQASPTAAQALRQWCEGERCSADWILIDQARISAFAEVTEDRYWLHTQPDRARAQAPFGGSIAHGFLLLSLTVGDDVVELGALPGVVQVLNYGLDKVRFLAPVRAGASVRVHSRVESMVERQPGQWLLRQIKTVQVRDQPRIALAAEQLALVTLR